MVVRPQEQRFSFDAGRVGVGDFARLLLTDQLQDPQGRVRADDSFVNARPFLVQIVLRRAAGPIVELDLGGARLIEVLGPLIGIVTRHVPKNPVARGASPGAGAAHAIEYAVGGDQRTFDASFCRQGVLIQRPLGGCVQEVLAGVRHRSHKGEERGCAQQSMSQ